MTSKELRDRWKSPDGRSVEEDAVLCLLGASGGIPEGFGTYRGRRDLRGRVMPPPDRLGSLTTGGDSSELRRGLVELRGVNWGRARPESRPPIAADA